MLAEVFVVMTRMRFWNQTRSIWSQSRRERPGACHSAAAFLPEVDLVFSPRLRASTNGRSPSPTVMCRGSSGSGRDVRISTDRGPRLELIVPVRARAVEAAQVLWRGRGFAVVAAEGFEPPTQGL